MIKLGDSLIMGGIYPFVNELQRYGKDGIESIRQNKLPQTC